MLKWCVWMIIQLTWAHGLVPRQFYHELSAVWFNQQSMFNVSEPYFGYSITYLPSSKQIIASAPKANNIGEIYACNIETLSCSKIPRSTFMNRYENKNYKNNYWYGAVVKAGSSYFVTCAPLYTTKDSRRDKAVTNASCYKYTSTHDANPEQLKVITEVERRRYSILEHQMDSFGWSIDVNEDDIMFGGPIMHIGRAAWYNLQVNKSYSLIAEPREFKYNFGYSVAIGKFFLDHSEMSYAVSSTYGYFGIGKVAIYNMNNSNLGTVYDSKQGVFLDENMWVGSMYGAVLASAKLFQFRQEDALLVGAPTFALGHAVNWGAVFVYLPARFPNSPQYHRTILGMREGSYFGNDIISVNDLNHDMLDEIAIGAPYEDDGRGAVYLYSGADITSDKSDILYMQRIAPSVPGIRSLGHSLTALQDYDDNGCNELAIGAPESNSIMLLRCIATVNIRLFVKIPPYIHIKKKVDPQYRNETHLNFESCLDVLYKIKPKTIYAEILVSVKIMHPNAKIPSTDEENYMIILDGTKKAYCKTITVETPEHGNYDVPINYELKATQVDSPFYRSKFEASRIAISDRSITELNGHISIADCAIADNCIVEMELTSIIFKELTSSPPQLIIGSLDKLGMDLFFVNKKEIAYDPCVTIDITSATVLQTPSGCEQYNNTYFKCAPETRLRQNEIWNTKLITLNTAELNNKDKEIKVNINLYEQCEKSKAKPYEKVVQLLTDHQGVKINAITDSGKDNVVKSTRAELEQGKFFQQKYIITNSGPTSWVDVKVELFLQKRFFITNKDYAVILRTLIKGQSPQRECYLFAETNSNLIYHCMIDKLSKNIVTAEIIITLLIIPDTLDAAISENLNTLYTALAVHLDDQLIMKHDLTTTFVITKLKWDIWIIIVAAMLGVILLIILIVVLSKRGFLRRKNREQLEQVQRSVKRQTIQRRSMAPSPRMQDEERLLEDPQVTSNPKKRIQVNRADYDE